MVKVRGCGDTERRRCGDNNVRGVDYSVTLEVESCCDGDTGGAAELL